MIKEKYLKRNKLLFMNQMQNGRLQTLQYTNVCSSKEYVEFVATVDHNWAML